MSATGFAVFLSAFSPAAPAGFTFAAYGDSRGGHDIHSAIVARILDAEPAFVLHGGDLSGDFYATPAQDWETIRGILAPLLAHPPSEGLASYFYPALGNHDISTANLRLYRETFATPPIDRLYYSFTHRNAHFIALCLATEWSGNPVDFSRESAQVRWLANDLEWTAADRRIKWTFVYFHLLLLSCTSTRRCSPAIQEIYLPLFERYGVTAVLSSHSHSYQRIGPLREFQPAADGVLYLVSGGGGADAYRIDAQDCNLSDFGGKCDAWTDRPHVPVALAAGSWYHHFLHFEVGEDRVVGRAIALDGSAIDEFVIEKPSRCGNGTIESGEECDDENLDDGDGCTCACELREVLFIRGDGNRDGAINVADSIAILNVLFAGRPGRCHDAMDADDDGALSLGDALRLVQYLFEAGTAPPAPFPEPGSDPTEDDLRCLLFP